MNVSIKIENSEAVISVAREAAGPVTDDERAAIGAEVARLLQRHLRARDASNAHAYPEGGRRSHFWRKAAEAVSFTHDDKSVTVTVAHQGVALRYAGAPEGIKPVNKKALAIPAHAHAYGRSPLEFNDLRIVVFRAQNKAALVRKPKKREYLGTVMFWLVRKTKPVPGDPTVLPPENVVLGLAARRLALMRSRRRAQKGAP